VTPAIARLLSAADAKIHASELLLREGHNGDAASRAYYGVFHAISALHTDARRIVAAINAHLRQPE